MHARTDAGHARLETGLALLRHLGRATLLAAAAIAALAAPRKWLRGALAEAHRQSLDALPLVLLLTIMGGALMSQQTGVQYERLPAWAIGSLVAASLITEMTPLLAGFALVGVIGARIAAELSAMEVTEQVDALEVIGRDPVAYLVVPRILGGLFVGTMLIALAQAPALVAGWIVAVIVTPATTADFWFGVRHYIRDFPLFYAVLKGAVFGASIAFIGCYVGLEARGGSAGVGRATTRGVVVMVGTVVAIDTLMVPLLRVIPT